MNLTEWSQKWSKPIYNKDDRLYVVDVRGEALQELSHLTDVRVDGHTGGTIWLRTNDPEGMGQPRMDDPQVSRVKRG